MRRPSRLVVIDVDGLRRDEVKWLRETVASVVADRCANEAQREPNVADMVPAVLALLGIYE